MAKRAYALFLWSADLGRWVPLSRSESFRKVELQRDILAFIGGMDICLADTPSIEADDVEAIGARLLPPVGATFVDSAPDGVLAEPEPFDELCFAAYFQARYQVWRAAVLDDVPPALRAEFASRLAFVEHSRAMDRLLAAEGLAGDPANDLLGPSAVH